jgi:hypothetical protein
LEEDEITGDADPGLCRLRHPVRPHDLSSARVGRSEDAIIVDIWDEAAVDPKPVVLFCDVLNNAGSYRVPQ